MRVLAIETSCDETAIALVDAQGTLKNPKFKIERSEVASQIKLHAKFGGVVPNLAKREHIRNLPILLRKIGLADFSKSKIKNQKSKFKDKKLNNNIDLIAVTVGPGLEPALWTGIQFAKELSKKWKKPIVGVNHLDGHLYSFFLAKKLPVKSRKLNLFPAISLIVSGGHTILAYMKDAKSYKKLGETLDDAIGESFDKVSRLLNLPYPGGPALENLAKKGDENSIIFPSPMINQKNYNFSYSGLKTSVLYYLKNLGSTANDFSLTPSQQNVLEEIEKKKNLKADIAASFQKAAFLPLVKKAINAAKIFKARTILIGGGVAANKKLAMMLKSKDKSEKLKINIIVPPLKYCMDNAVMIAVAAFVNSKNRKKYPISANGNLNL